MTRYNAENERVKRRYFTFLKRGEAAERSIDRCHRQGSKPVRDLYEVQEFQGLPCPTGDGL